jgi:hypothetical protein
VTTPPTSDIWKPSRTGGAAGNQVRSGNKPHGPDHRPSSTRGSSTLDGYWAYLNHPAHVREELWGIPNHEKFAAIDV